MQSIALHLQRIPFGMQRFYRLAQRIEFFEGGLHIHLEIRPQRTNKSSLRDAFVVNYSVAAHGCQIDTIEQPVQLLHGQFDHW